jgi:trk system potassium uptake protein TrkH
VVIWDRAIDRGTIDRSTTLIILSIIFVIASTFIMLTIKDFDIGHTFESVFFETVSAFGTVGLSMGITNQLPDMDKIILSVVMFVGRLGPLTLIIALTSGKKEINIKYPEEHIMIG